MDHVPPDSIIIRKVKRQRKPSEVFWGRLTTVSFVLSLVVGFGFKVYRATRSLPPSSPPRSEMTQQEIEEFKHAVQSGEAGPAFRALLGEQTEEKQPP